MKTRDLLPNYLRSEDIWSDLADGIDHVFGDINLSMKALQNLRNVFIMNETVGDKVERGEMVEFADFDYLDPQTTLNQISHLGLQVSQPSGLPDNIVRQLSRNIGGYWFSKGTSSFAEFLGFCLNAPVTVSNTWTQDYSSFFPEGDPVIGTPVWENGGTWYPTTHVMLGIDTNSMRDASLSSFVNLFNDIANYNLVLQSIIFKVNLGAGDEGAMKVSVNLGLYPVVKQTIRNY